MESILVAVIDSQVALPKVVRKGLLEEVTSELRSKR